MKKRFLLYILPVLLVGVGAACKGGVGSSSGQSAAAEASIVVPTFDADSAYHYIEKQLAFGPRVPNTAGHRACGQYLAAELAARGAQVYSQEVELPAYDGTLLKARNIVASYKPETKKRIALFAHWDTRPWADNDEQPSHHYTPILGANDGASGVAVLLEIARLLHTHALPELGIDLVLFDAEDYGAHQTYAGEHREEYWCLGSQHWSRQPHVPGYTARFGILLDMVGGQGARFYKEGYSELYAAGINKKVWRAAKRLGYGALFVDEAGATTTDDHLFVNRLAKIPTIDIIPYYAEGSFTPTWHTVNDNLEHIDRQTLKAVGQTVLEVIYRER